MHAVLRLAAAGAAAFVLATGGFAVADDDGCREEFGDGQRVDAGPLTVYTDNAETYLGVCGFGRNGYVQVNEIAKAVRGEQHLAEGRTGFKDIDKAISNGPIKVWLVRDADEDSCAPEGDDTAGGGGGRNSLTGNLPTVYTDGGTTHAGVCDRDGRYVQVNEVTNAAEGEEVVEFGERDDDD